MIDFPDFSSYGFTVIRELGYNPNGGRVTYQAKQIDSQEEVVIKQFQFARSQDWCGFKAYEREIQVLQGLTHPGIPRYLNSFETPSGFCMVQEYKNAQTLAVRRSFAPDEIKQIAIDLLKILGYLQNRIPPIIHRDLKPENILIDSEMNVYLIDFGLARIGAQEVAMSSVALGTLGFMAPEQIYSRQLTEATDLYSLGATLIALLTGTKSTAMDSLIDEDGRIAFQHLVPKLSLRFIEWLAKMVHPKVKERFQNAEAALEALQSLYIIRLPELKVNQPSLHFKANELGARLTSAIALSNSIPETVLEGRWEVAPHESDPPHTPEMHAWISLKPESFATNHLDCIITVDTKKLMANKVYKRQLRLYTNSHATVRMFDIQVQTATLPIKDKKLPFFLLSLLIATSSILPIEISYIHKAYEIMIQKILEIWYHSYGF
jgi:serine/threonine protein kinase